MQFKLFNIKKKSRLSKIIKVIAMNESTSTQ